MDKDRRCRSKTDRRIPSLSPILINISLIDIHKGETRDIALDATIRAAAPDTTYILP